MLFFCNALCARLASKISALAALWLFSGVVCAQGLSQDSDASHRTQRLTQLTESGVRFEHAEGVERDYTKALSFYCAAAREGHPDAIIRLGWMYANARGVARDDDIAGTLFKKAADFGSDIALRLTDLVRPPLQAKLPACMSEKNALAPLDPATAAEKTAGVTPTIVNPAQFRNGPTSIERKRLVQMVTNRAKEAHVDPRLVFAVIFAESNFDPLVRSAKGAQGLMQLIPETAERFGVSDVQNPEENIRGGVAYLKWLLSYFRGDVWLAIAGYNAGEGAVDRFKGIPPYSETMAYVQKIRALYPRDFHAFDARIVLPTAFLTKR